MALLKRLILLSVLARGAAAQSLASVLSDAPQCAVRHDSPIETNEQGLGLMGAIGRLLDHDIQPTCFRGEEPERDMRRQAIRRCDR